ncbi:unnamed protein product [Ascophyllum nodosum]
MGILCQRMKLNRRIYRPSSWGPTAIRRAGSISRQIAFVKHEIQVQGNTKFKCRGNSELGLQVEGK